MIPWLYRTLFHCHRWSLADNTVVAPVTCEVPATTVYASDVPRMLLGYVVLTFTCPCGQYRIEER